MQGRILALDYGRRRIGVAVSDSLGLTAQPFTTWSGLDEREVVARVVALTAEIGVKAVVVGLPLTSKGEEGPIVFRIRRLVGHLQQALSIPVYLQDERLTTVEAEKTLHAVGIKPSRRKEIVDQIAAVLILQTFIAKKAREGKPS